MARGRGNNLGITMNYRSTIPNNGVQEMMLCYRSRRIPSISGWVYGSLSRGVKARRVTASYSIEAKR